MDRPWETLGLLANVDEQTIDQGIEVTSTATIYMYRLFYRHLVTSIRTDPTAMGISILWYPPIKNPCATAQGGPAQEKMH